MTGYLQWAAKTKIYADDTHIYITMKPRQEVTGACMEQFVTDVRIWMKTNFLKLNDSKTEVTFGSTQQLEKIKLQALRVGDCLVRVIHSIRKSWCPVCCREDDGVACDCCIK